MPEERTIPTTRPATVVTPVILIDGSEIARTWQVDSITVRKEVNRIPWAKLVILDGDASAGAFAASNDSLFIPGKTIEVKCGYQSDLFTIFEGIILTHSVKLRSNSGSMLVLECRDRSVRMSVGRKSRYFSAQKDSEIIADIAGTYNDLTFVAESTSVTHQEMVQYDATDWDFMLSRAEANGRLCIPDDGHIRLIAPDPGQSPVLSLLYGATMLEFDAEIDARHQLSKVTSRSWSAGEQKIVTTEGADPGISLNGNIPSANLAKVIDLEEYRLDHGGSLEEEELQAWSDALLLRRQMAKVRGRVKCKGVHTVKPGMIINLGGIGDRFNGNAFVSGVQHFISAGDWTLDIQFGMEPEWFTRMNEINERPAAGLLSVPNGLQSGVVTRIDEDPEAQCRIKVRIPMISDTEEGQWARLATLDAGKERGSFFLPEVGDEVIVGFVNDDPRDAVVLGMLNSSAMPAPLTASAANPRKGFVTRSKMQLLFDDEKKQCTILTPSGKTVVLDEEADAITIADDHQNSIVMDAGGIVIKSQGKIEIKAQQELKLGGLNVGMKADASVKVEASASAELKSGGPMTVKGAVVQIN
ncbi:MAG: type VI secretion system tip protein VgrG [Chlorobiaceae bacterium]|nr:type VI secretion system tip protein VgrG [Chlorobiaceae bacterium]